MAELDKDIVSLLARRAYDLAGTCSGVKVYLNGNRLPVSEEVMRANVYVNALYLKRFPVTCSRLLLNPHHDPKNQNVVRLYVYPSPSLGCGYGMKRLSRLTPKI